MHQNLTLTPLRCYPITARVHPRQVHWTLFIFVKIGDVALRRFISPTYRFTVHPGLSAETVTAVTQFSRLK